MIHPFWVLQTAKNCCSGRSENQAHVGNTQQIKLSVKSQRSRLAAFCARVREQQNNRRERVQLEDGDKKCFRNSNH